MLVIATGVTIFAPSIWDVEFPNLQNEKQAKQNVNERQLVASSAVFRVGGQRFFPELEANGDGDDDFEVDVRATPIKRLVVKANVVSVKKGDLQVFHEDFDYID